MLSALNKKFSMFPVLYSTSTLSESEEKKLYKPSELDIYNEPLEKAPVARPPPSPVLLYENVSVLRKSFTGVFSGILSTHEKMSNTMTRTEEKLRSAYKQTLEDPYYLLTPGAILLAAAGGAIVAGKGKRPVKRTFYALVFGTTAASVSYPQRAMEIATTGYYHTTGAVNQLISTIKNSTNSKTVTEKAIEKSPVETMSDELDNTDDNYIDPTLNAENYGERQADIKVEETREVHVDGKDVAREIEFGNNKARVEGDIGQSNPDDADMYSTRS